MDRSQTYTAIRYDFVLASSICEFCNKALTSDCAYVLQSSNGEVYFAGPICAKRASLNGDQLRAIPNLTKGYISLKKNQTHGESNNSGNRGQSKQSIDDVQKSKLLAEEYLLLRELKLGSLNKSFSYDPLTKYFKILEEDELTNNQIQHILNIEKNAGALLKRSELQAKYICISLIDRGLEKWPENEILLGIKNTLLTKRLHVTTKQISAINNIVAAKGISRQINPAICKQI